MTAKLLFVLATAALVPFNVVAKSTHANGHGAVSNDVVAEQRHSLAENTQGKRGWTPITTRYRLCQRQ